MSGDSWIINSAEKLTFFIAQVKKDFEQHKYLRIKMIPGKARSLDSSALSHVWYEQIAKATGSTPADVKREAKLIYGIPILRRDEAFSAFYDAQVKKNYTFEQKLKLMDYLAVTSLFSTVEMTEYLNTMQADYAARDIILEAI